VAFKLVAHDQAGNASYVVSEGLLSVGDLLDADGSRPDESPAVAIRSIAPNPAQGRVQVQFTLAQASRATIALFDLQGRPVARLLDSECPAGQTSIEWTTSSAVRHLSPGIYFLQLNTWRGNDVAKFLLTN
jgi:hypothetical protein